MRTYGTAQCVRRGSVSRSRSIRFGRQRHAVPPVVNAGEHADNILVAGEQVQLRQLVADTLAVAHVCLDRRRLLGSVMVTGQDRVVSKLTGSKGVQSGYVRLPGALQKRGRAP